ncbi:MAG: protein-tyrosine kinase [Chloroflexota bacterium]|nr:protein-tyrosine kinase [Chloroflexota bacterium]
MTRGSKKGPSGGPADLVTLLAPRSAAAEAYRTLWTNLRFGGLEQTTQLVLVTSARPDEGKTTTLANLGVVAAQAGARVILVDADFRRPQLHELFGVDNSRGLTSVLLGDLDLEAAVSEVGVDGLLVLATGPVPPNPAEVMRGTRIDEVLTRLRTVADLVLLDSPPVSAAADASALASRVDGVVLVLDARRTRRDPARRAKEQLERVNARLLGVVLNNAQLDADAYRY